MKKNSFLSKLPFSFKYWWEFFKVERSPLREGQKITALVINPSSSYLGIPLVEYSTLAFSITAPLSNSKESKTYSS